MVDKKAFKKWKEEDYSNSKLCAETTINLPNWPGMRQKNVNKVIHGLLNQNIISFAKTHAFDVHWSKNLSQEIPEAKKIVAHKFLKPILDLYHKSTQSFMIL